MSINIAANIRAFRKERRLTQEQLAEVLGVTIGAVSKWESGASTPDIALIVEMAGFFETSVDMLLGYELSGGSLERALGRIKSLRNEKRFDEAAAEAEKALVRFPNSFDVAHRSALLYGVMGTETGSKKHFHRALELLRRSLELAGQNTDDHINEWTIRNDIARVYLCLEQNQDALDELKRNNAAGLNDGDIGLTLAVAEKKPDEAMPYLSRALVKDITNLFSVVMSYASAYTQKGDYDNAAAVLIWMRGLLDGLKKPGAITHLDKETVMLETACAIIYAKAGDMDEARKRLRRAIDSAAVFDASPTFGFVGMRFYVLENDGTIAFDDFGPTAAEGIRRRLAEDGDAVAPALIAMFEELAKDNG